LAESRLSDRAHARCLAAVAAAAVLAPLCPHEICAQPTAFSPAETRRLDRGEVLTRFWRAGTAGAGWAVGVIDAPPEKVFRVVADVERYKEFMYRMVQSRIEGRSGSVYHFYYKIDMPWPLSDYWCVTRNVHQLDRARRIYARRWTLDSGTFHRNEGSWSVQPWGKARSLLLYSVVLLPKTAAPTALVNYGTRVALPRSVRQFRERVEKLITAGRL
jgi:ribosome-associated toxin RatA of RatAB toxin-antitoxin module